MPEIAPVNLKANQGAPVYEAEQTISGEPRVGLEPIPIRHLPENTIGADIAELGKSVQGFAEKFANAQKAADATHALTNYLVNLDAAKQAGLRNQDWKNAPANFGAAADQAAKNALEPYKFDPETTAKLQQHFAIAKITAGDEIAKSSLAKGSSQWLADYQTAAQFNQNQAATAGSDLARSSAIARNDALIQTGIGAGWISPARGAELKQNFHEGLDHATAMHLVANNPAGAVGVLADPNNLPSLSAPQRESYIENAHTKIDNDATDRARGLVAGRPYVASLVAGQFVDSGHIGELYDRAVVPQESNGQNAPPNAKGAFGPGQVTPAFVRDYAGKLPPEEQAALGDVSKMSDKELTDKLMANPKLSTDIGRIGFRELANRYGGNPVLAMAAYNAGPKRADEWKAAAEQKFGPNPTPAQIASVIDIPETQKYVTDIYRKAGAPMDAFGVSPAGRFHLGQTLGTELQTQQTRDQHVINQIASVDGATDPVPKMIEQGLDVGADRIAKYRSEQSAAAANGDAEAARRLHELDLAIAVKPQVDRLYRSPFNVTNALVDAADAQARQPGADTSADAAHTLQVLKTTRDNINTARIDNPTALIVKAKLAPQVALDTAADPASPDFRAALTARGGQAMMAQKLYGGTALALTPEETQSLKQRYATAPPQEQFAMLRTLAETLPQASYTDTVKAVLGDIPGAAIIGRFAADRPDLAQQMLQGAELAKTKEAAESQKAIRPIMAGFLKGQLYPTPDQQNAVIESALYLDMARRNARGALYDAGDTSGVQQAIEDVTGALTSRNGAQVAAPIGMRAGQFNAILDGLNARDVALAGGATDRNGNAVTPQTISNNAVLKQTAPGSPRYWVGVADPSARDGFQPYFTSGEIPAPLVFDMRELAAGVQNRVTAGDTARQREAATKAGFAEQ